MNKTCDVVVIGGGINGAVIAFELASAGVSVILVEKDSICSGPTARSCGIIRQHYSHEVPAKMARDGLRIFRHFSDEVGGDCEFHQTGFLLTAREDTIKTIAANVALQQGVGIDTRMVTPAAIREIEPHAKLDGIVAGAWEPDAGYADPWATTNAYIALAVALGAEILTGVQVTEIETAGGRVSGVATNGGTISAGAVAIATGPWAASLLKPLGIDLPTEIGRVQVGLFDRPETLSSHGIFADTNLGTYSRPEGDLMLVGSLETTDAELTVDDPDYYNAEVDFSRIESYSDRIMRRYPEMQSGAFHNGYASLYDITPDWQPIVGALPPVDGLYGAIGSSGHGFKLAPSIGKLLANLVLGKRVDREALEFFALDRFEQGQRGDSGYAGHKILG
jgi:sarcosine oxidase subunit beta